MKFSILLMLIVVTTIFDLTASESVGLNPPGTIRCTKFRNRCCPIDTVCCLGSLYCCRHERASALNGLPQRRQRRVEILRLD